MENRSLPVSTVLPHIFYENVPKAVEWLTRVFGFCERYRYGEPGNESGAQMFAGSAYIMVQRSKGHPTPAELGFGTQSLTIFLDDVEVHCERVKAAVATIVELPHETVYGELQYAARDLDGHLWLFSRHARDLAPADWGAVEAQR